MSSFKKILEKLKQVTKENLRDQVQKIVENDQEIIDLKQDRFEQGLKPDNNIIGTYRNPAYQQMKQRMNPRAGGDVDLILTGSFTNKLFVQGLGNSRFLFDSTDDKTPILTEKYGDDIFGFNDKDWERLQAEKYAPQLIKYIKQQTGL
jgi:cytoplasmic iron level regulating protein YaaA (DUF328/UPF0246 family)